MSTKAPTDIAARLAETTLASLGIACIHIADVVGTETLKLTVGDIGARREAGARIWFRSAAEAAQVYETVLSRCRNAARMRRHLILILTNEAEAVGLVTDKAHAIGVHPVKDVDVITMFDGTRGRIEKALGKLRKDGGMKTINARYQNLRAGGGKVPSWSTWFVDEMSGTMAQLAGFAPSAEPDRAMT